MKVLLLVLLSVRVSNSLQAQSSLYLLQGKVIYKEGDMTKPLEGASVYGINDPSNGTATGDDGRFELELNEAAQFIVSFVGFKTDTLNAEAFEMTIEMQPDLTLSEVEIVHERKGVQIDYLNPLKSEFVSEKELLKAACCNLSESFDTNPSVDVSFTDAVTGTRQIQMLGLAGPYAQITRENMPNVRGLSAIYGLMYIPGTWIESIQVNKGAGSVTNGFESIAGQINTELRKTSTGDRLYANLYANEMGRVEANLNFRMETNDRWSTATLLHANINQVANDRNDDSFLDNPRSKHIIALNRWRMVHENGIRLQLGVKGTYIDNLGGQVGFDPDEQRTSNGLWGMSSQTRRLEGWAKVGKVYYDQPWKSLGLQVSGVWHEEDSYFGLRDYDGTQGSFYSNFIYQSILFAPDHRVKMGASLQYDRLTEKIDEIKYQRNEFIPGLFAEYAYDYQDKLNLLVGLRADHHTNYGPFVTPRLHARYALTESTVLRASVGRGLRTASIFAENIGVLASSREILVEGSGTGPYGLEAEVAWNYGLNVTQEFTLDYRIGTVAVDLYRTDFENQIILDLDRDTQQAAFYNLNGKSYSSSFQLQVDYELVKRLDTRIGYRWLDVKSTYDDGLMSKPLLSEHRLFLNLGYESRKHWKADYTINWQGQKRIPMTGTNPESLRLEAYSPNFFVMNAQISKSWKSGLEIYIGVENLLNYRQSDPILSSEDPFSEYFDASMVWGPIFGRNTYMGLRYRLI